MLRILVNSIIRGWKQLARRPLYICMMVIVPLVSAWFFFDLMKDGAVQRTPVGIVDLDKSDLSRKLTRNLNAFQQVNIINAYNTYQDAIDAVQRGEVYGFFFIPSDFSTKALSNKKPTLSYYINYSFFAPASMQFKGFKTLTVLANGGIVSNVLTTFGLPREVVGATLQPIVTHVHPLKNPWMSYNYYLNGSFVPCLLALIVMLITVFSIGMEWHAGTSRNWLRTADNSIVLATFTKLFPQSFIFINVGLAIQYMMYVKYGFPLNCNPWNMIAAMALLVLACQGFALFVISLVPNFRYASTICTLLGMLSFSFCGFSLPEEAMYSWVAPLGYLMPIKYYFFIYVDQALNGIELYYSRYYYVILIAYGLLPITMLWKLRKHCLDPFYIP